MRNYFITKFSRTIGANTHIYNAATAGTGRNATFTGEYLCEDLIAPENRKIATDFICMPNSAITGIKDNNRNLIFEVGEITNQGTIRQIRLNNRRAEVLLNAARTVYVDITTLTKVQQEVAQPARAAAAVQPIAPSRSTLTTEITDLQTKILAYRDIRFEKLLKKNIPATLKDFLITFFKTYNVEKNTIFVGDKTVQTPMGKRRSLGDIYKLCKYYYPTCTLKEVLTLLYVTLPGIINPGFRTSYCNTIKKRVWYYAPTQGNGVYDATNNDEYGHTVEWYKSKL